MLESSVKYKRCRPSTELTAITVPSRIMSKNKQQPLALNDEGLGPLREALAVAQRPYYAVGDIPVTESFKLLIALNESSVTFPAPSPKSLEPLLEASQQASFGRGRDDVLDPAVRRALVLHAKDFGIAPSSAVDPYVLDIISAIQTALLGSTFDPVRQRIVPVIDKLNVYGKGDFFKTHVDTPKAPNMFGTLLINLPVKHVGGRLVIRAPSAAGDGTVAQNGASFETKWGGVNSLGWVAFFSDCTHEVLPVTSGHR